MRTFGLTNVVFIGGVGAMTGDRALQAEVRKRMLIIRHP
jgi:hypothetical protein